MSTRAIAIRTGVLAATLALATIPALGAVASAVPRATVPDTPTAVSLTTGAKSLTVSWSEASSGTIAYTATAKSSGLASKSCATKKLTCKITGLINGAPYVVTVVAATKAGASAPSAPVSATADVPGAPRSVSASGLAGEASVSWLAPKANGTGAVTLYMAVASPGGYACSTSGTVLSAPARTCVITGLAAGVYSVTVTATNAFGTGSPSAPASVTVQ